MQSHAKTLAVDDEPLNLMILERHLRHAGFEVISAENGPDALQKLEAHPDIGVIVLDRMMPGMNGIEVVRKIKADARFSDIPVVMQTAAAGSQQVVEGIQAGVYYYLTKPYDEAMLVSIVKAALSNASDKKIMREEVQKHKRALGLMEQGHFHFRTLEEAKNLAYFIANCSPNPEALVYSLSELMINAVEHGNLGISYSEKTQLLRSGAWQEEIERRLSLPENAKKYAYLSFNAENGAITARIRDQGNGFDWKNYLDISPSRVTDPNGRGIAISRLSFSTFRYIGKGNEVLCVLTNKQ